MEVADQEVGKEGDTEKAMEVDKQPDKEANKEIDDGEDARKDEEADDEEKPRFVSSPTTSCLAFTDYAHYNALDAAGKRQLFEGRNTVIVRHWPVDPNLKFDEAGLRTVAARLTSPVDLLGQSSLYTIFS